MARAGRPSIIDAQFDQQRTKLLKKLKKGASIADACRLTGLSMSAVMRAMQRGRKAGKANEPYREFRDEVRQAIADAKVVLIERWHNASRRNWRAAMAMLRARHPEEFALDVIVRNLLKDMQDGDDLDIPEIRVRRMSAEEQAERRARASEKPDSAAEDEK